MNTIYVWVLTMWVSTGPVTIDNISTKEECVRVEQVIRKSRQRIFTQCIEVQKVKQ